MKKQYITPRVGITTVGATTTFCDMSMPGGTDPGETVNGAWVREEDEDAGPAWGEIVW